MRLPLLLAVLLVPASAQANLIYTYTGDTFLYATGDFMPHVTQITGSFLLTDNLTLPDGIKALVNVTSSVMDWNFTDGIRTFTPNNSLGAFSVGFTQEGLPVLPGSGGPISWWTFTITNATGGLTANYINAEWESTAWTGDRAVPASVAYINGEYRADIWGGTAGTWTVEPTPEPAALALLLLGAIMLGVRRHSTSPD